LGNSNVEFKKGELGDGDNVCLGTWLESTLMFELVIVLLNVTGTAAGGTAAGDTAIDETDDDAEETDGVLLVDDDRDA
jgi:hypothetical protein